MAFLTKKFKTIALNLQIQFAAAFKTVYISPASTQPT